MSASLSWRLGGAMRKAGVRGPGQLRALLGAHGHAISESQVQRLVTNGVERPSLRLLAALCSALHVDLHEILRLEVDDESPSTESDFAVSSNIRPFGRVRPPRREWVLPSVVVLHE